MAMFLLGTLAALGASLSWAVAAIMAHEPARHLGAIRFTRLQLATSAILLMSIVIATERWVSLSWRNWPELLANCVIGVVLANLAMVACLRRGGPQRTQLLMTVNAPVTALLGYIFLHETLSWQELAGGGLTIAGVALAIGYGTRAQQGSGAPAGSLLPILAFGIGAAIFQAIGFVVIKPILRMGADPLAVSAVRTVGGAAMLGVVGFWHLPNHNVPAGPDGSVKQSRYILVCAVVAGFLGYIVAVSLLLYALANLETGIAVVLGSLSPVIMLPILWMRTGIRPSWPAWLGAGLTVFGVGLIAVH